MKRLTTDEPYPHGAEGVSEDRLTGRFCRGKFECIALIERLSKYENTGLEPTEIEVLKGNGGRELEKILEEIEKLKEMYKESSFALLDKGNLPCEYDKADIESTNAQALSQAIAIIRKHMNNNWISVHDRLPENAESKKGKKQRTTNADRIRQMGDDDLADFLIKGCMGESRAFCSHDEMVEWLRWEDSIPNGEG